MHDYFLARTRFGSRGKFKKYLKTFLPRFLSIFAIKTTRDESGEVMGYTRLGLRGKFEKYFQNFPHNLICN